MTVFDYLNLKIPLIMAILSFMSSYIVELSMTNIF